MFRMYPSILLFLLSMFVVINCAKVNGTLKEAKKTSHKTYSLFKYLYSSACFFAAVALWANSQNFVLNSVTQLIGVIQYWCGYGPEIRTAKYIKYKRDRQDAKMKNLLDRLWEESERQRYGMAENNRSHWIIENWHILLMGTLAFYLLVYLMYKTERSTQTQNQTNKHCKPTHLHHQCKTK